MLVRKTLSVLLSVCVLLTAFIFLPSVNAQAMNADIVVITSETAAVRSLADPTASQFATASRSSTFLLLDSGAGSDGVQWYRIYFSPSVSGWVSSADAYTERAFSTTNDPYTLYLKRTARVNVDSYTLRAQPGDSADGVAVVSRNERMVVLGYGDDGNGISWYEVRYGALKGWIKRTAVELTNICSSPGPVDCSREIPVIYLSPSRQPANPFAAGNTNECEQMTRVAEALRVILEREYDCIVYMAEFKTPIAKFSRPLEAYNLGADIYLAIHSNAAGSAGHGYGTQAYYFPGSAQNRLMAENLVKSVSAIAPFSNDAEGAYNGMNYFGGQGYGEVRDPGGFGMQSVLLEVEFHDRVDSALWIINNTEAIAQAIADGLEQTYSFRPKGTFTTTTTTAALTTTSAAPTQTTTTVPIQDGHSPLGTTAATTTTTAPTTTTTTTTIATTTTTTTTTAVSTTAGTSTTAATSTTTTPTTTAPAQVVRAGGSDRIETAIEISAMGWGKADTVIIASGSSYPDALAGVPLSAAADAPILLTTDKNGPEAGLLAEIARLGAKKAYILGGSAAVSEAAERSLTAAGVVCTRLSGSDRYGTCVAVANELVHLSGKDFDTLYFASADNFPDALAISPVAAMDGAPILYIGANSNLQLCVAEFAAQTDCTRAVLLGGEAAVSNAGQVSIEGLGLTVERISGSDRYATAAAVNARFAGKFFGSGAAVATGQSFPDALAGGAHAARLGIPLLLAGNEANSALLSFAESSCTPGSVYVYGGVNAVSEATAQAVLEAVN